MAIPIKATLKVVSKQFTTGIKLAGRAVGGLVAVAKAATFAIIGLTAAFTAIVARQAAVIDRIGKVAKVTGVAAETLQKFGFAAEQAGVSSDQAQVALRRFSRRLGEAQKGAGELLPALKKLGIETRRADGTFKSAEEVLFEFADGIANTDDASQRLALAFKAFDSEGAELVNTLMQGADGLKAMFDEATALGAVLSASSIQGVEDFNDSMNSLQTLIAGVTNAFVAELAPALDEITKDFTDFIQKVAKEKGGFDSLASFLKNEFIDIVVQLISLFTDLINAVVTLGRSIPGTDLFAVEGTKEAREEYDRLAESLNILNRARRTLQDGSGGIIAGSLEGLRRLFTLDPSLYAKTIKSLKEVGVATANLEATQGELGFFDELLRQFAIDTEAQEAFKASLLNAVTVGIEAAEKEIEKFNLFDSTGIEEYLLSLKDIGGVVVETVKDFTVATTTTNRELDLTLGYWERIILQIGDFFTRDLPQKIKDTIELLKTIGKTAAERLLALADPVKTLEDGLVKAGQSFEDSLVKAIMTGKSSFEDFRNILRETFARAIIQRFITGPIFDLFKAKGGPVSAGSPYIVGEKGPELFIPGATGTIIPNSNMGGAGGGGGQQVTYNINAVDTQSFQQALARDPEFLFNVTQRGARSLPSRG